MSEETHEEQAEFQPITSQEEFDRALGQRLARERAKFADYAELKEKAAKFDEAEQAAKSELEKAIERADAAEKKAAQLEAANQVAAWKQEVSAETGVPAAVLAGSTREEIAEHAAQIVPLIAQKETAPVRHSPADKGEPDLALNGKGVEDMLRRAVGL